MSCSLTTEAVRRREKTVTRRRTDTWTQLKAGDRLTLVEKAMGVPKGSRQVVLAEVEIVKVGIEPLWPMTTAELQHEGCGHMTPAEFQAMWLESYGYRSATAMGVLCRRIEWRYL